MSVANPRGREPWGSQHSYANKQPATAVIRILVYPWDSTSCLLKDWGLDCNIMGFSKVPVEFQEDGKFRLEVEILENLAATEKNQVRIQREVRATCIGRERCFSQNTIISL